MVAGPCNRIAEPPVPGKVILLNGASSSGKSSIAAALQAAIEEPFLHYGFDHLRESGVIPLDRFRNGDFQWPLEREAIFDGLHRSIQAFSAAGNNLIVDHIVETPDWIRRLIGLLADSDVFFVGIHCPLEELERREIARGDRRPGEARRDHEAIHRHAVYDLELNSLEPPAENAAKLLGAWRGRTKPTAFDRMAQSF
jgi:chloramphenicol 3-O phosphotransferase